MELFKSHESLPLKYVFVDAAGNILSFELATNNNGDYVRRLRHCEPLQRNEIVQLRAVSYLCCVQRAELIVVGICIDHTDAVDKSLNGMWHDASKDRLRSVSFQSTNTAQY